MVDDRVLSTTTTSANLASTENVPNFSYQNSSTIAASNNKQQQQKQQQQRLDLVKNNKELKNSTIINGVKETNSNCSETTTNNNNNKNNDSSPKQLTQKNDSTKSTSTVTTITIGRNLDDGGGGANSNNNNNNNLKQSVITHPISTNNENNNNNNNNNNEDDSNSLILFVQQKFFENYHLLAYTLIIGTYFIAFCEYLYLRLISLIFPAKIIYKQQCAKHINETIVRNEIHYASATIIFMCIGIFQVVCFFLLTVSGKWLDVRRSFTTFISMEERLRHELAFAIKRVMFTTIFPTFLVYVMCSAVIICSIFYMVGMRDPVQHTGSQVLIYFFDGCVMSYFLSFPIICLLYHPDIECCRKKTRRLQMPYHPNNKGSVKPRRNESEIAYDNNNDNDDDDDDVNRQQQQRKKTSEKQRNNNSEMVKQQQQQQTTGDNSIPQQKQQLCTNKTIAIVNNNSQQQQQQDEIHSKQNSSQQEIHSKPNSSNSIERTLQKLPTPADIGQQSRRLLRFDKYRRLSDSELFQSKLNEFIQISNNNNNNEHVVEEIHQKIINKKQQIIEDSSLHPNITNIEKIIIPPSQKNNDNVIIVQKKRKNHSKFDKNFKSIVERI